MNRWRRAEIFNFSLSSSEEPAEGLGCSYSLLPNPGLPSLLQSIFQRQVQTETASKLSVEQDKWVWWNQYRSYTCFVSSSRCQSILSQPGIMAVTEICPGWSRSKYKGMHVWLWQGNEPCHKHYSNIGFVRYYQGDSSILVMIHPWPTGLNNSIFQWYHTRVQGDDHILPRTRNSGLTAPQPCCGACIEVMFLEKPSLSHHLD